MAYQLCVLALVRRAWQISEETLMFGITGTNPTAMLGD